MTNGQISSIIVILEAITGGEMAARQYEIYFWHGQTDSLKSELMAIEGVSQDEDALHYIGTLDNFAEKYGRHFIVRAPGNLICVTQYNSWGAR